MKVWKVVIPVEVNNHVPFLFNHALDLTNKYKSGGVFANRFIALDRVGQDAIAELNKLKIIHADTRLRE